MNDETKRIESLLCEAEAAAQKNTALAGTLESQLAELETLKAGVRAQLMFYEVATAEMKAAAKLFDLARATVISRDADPQTVANIVAIAEDAIQARQKAEWQKFKL